MARPHHPARTPLRPSRTLLAAAIAGGIALTPLPATADPEAPLTSSEAAARLADKGRELEVVSERVNEAREQLAQQKDAAEAAAADVAEALAALDDARQQVRTVARGAYTGSSLTTFEVMLASKDPEDLLDRVGMLTTVARYNGGVLDDATAAGAQAREARATAEAAAAEATALVRRVTAQQAVLDRQVDTYKADYERLLAEEEAAREAAEQAAREAAERASRATRAAAAPAAAPAPAQTPAQGADTSTAAAPPAPVASGGSAAARTAVSTALAQVGDSYVWGAAGPGSFDCSGLTQYAYAAAGISLPHSSRMQATMGSPVSVSALQPGDLLFYYSPVSHVSMYVGNGQMVHASTYGQPVKVVGIGDMPSFSHAVRIV